MAEQDLGLEVSQGIAYIRKLQELARPLAHSRPMKALREKVSLNFLARATVAAEYYGCDVCTLTLAGSGETAVLNLDYALPNPACYPPPADGGRDASSSLVEHQVVPIPLPPFCGIAAPDGGASRTITEIVLQPDGDAAPFLPTIPSAYCEFLPGPTVAEPRGCLLTNLENEVCVSDCKACP